MTTGNQKKNPSEEDFSLPSFGYSKVALVLTGSAVTQVMPYWIEWARKTLPETEFRIIMRESAYRFVTRHSIESSARSRIQNDTWTDEIIAEHIDIAEWADLILIYPATLDYVSRLAHGITDSPSLLAAFATNAQVCVAPAFPPRSHGHPTINAIMEKLRAPDNYQVIDPIPGPSESSDTALAWVPPTFVSVLRQIEARRLARVENEYGKAA